MKAEKRSQGPLKDLLQRDHYANSGRAGPELIVLHVRRNPVWPPSFGLVVQGKKGLAIFGRFVESTPWH
ncbi:MAG: hypothetical protein CMF59_10465 [Leptospiraceae bacterium]|nr:hypothetical protein [Leptospiraceae bacterium]